MARLVVFDMDGVLADVQSSWVFVHKYFKVTNEHSLHAYLRGEIDDREFIRRDIKLWRQKEPGIDRHRIDGILAEVPLMAGARETMSQLREKGVKTAIVSAGIDLLAERIEKELGMDYQVANGLETDARGKLTGDGILRVRLMDKGNAVFDVADRFRVDREDIVSVGNSRYDVSMFSRSGKGIAFRPSDDNVRAMADAIVESDLTGVLRHI